MAFISSTTQGRLSLTNWELHTTLLLPPSVTHLAKRDKLSSVGETYKMGISVMLWFFFYWCCLNTKNSNMFYTCKQTKKKKVFFMEFEPSWKLTESVITWKNIFRIKCYTLMEYRASAIKCHLLRTSWLDMHFRCLFVAYNKIYVLTILWCYLNDGTSMKCIYLPEIF